MVIYKYIYIYIYILYAVSFEHFNWLFSVHLLNTFFLFISNYFNTLRDFKFSIRHLWGLESSEIWRSVAWLVVPKFSKNRGALFEYLFKVLVHYFIFRSWSNFKFLAFSPLEIFFTLIIIIHHFIPCSIFFFYLI